MTIRIIGGGIIGLSTAYHLSKEGDEIVVYEIDKAYEKASFARSCGGMRSQFSTPTNILMSRYSIDFVKNQTDVTFTPNGYLMLFDHDRQQDHDHSLALQQRLGATTTSMQPEVLAREFPFLSTDDLYRGCITRDGSEGWIDPNALHQWYRSQCRAAGVQFQYSDFRKASFTPPDTIIITAGFWTREVAQHFNIEVPVRGEKHTVFRVQTSKPVIADLPLVADLASGVVADLLEIVGAIEVSEGEARDVRRDEHVGELDAAVGVVPPLRGFARHAFRHQGLTPLAIDGRPFGTQDENLQSVRFGRWFSSGLSPWLLGVDL